MSGDADSPGAFFDEAEPEEGVSPGAAADGMMVDLDGPSGSSPGAAAGGFGEQGGDGLSPGAEEMGSVPFDEGLSPGASPGAMGGDPLFEEGAPPYEEDGEEADWDLGRETLDSADMLTERLKQKIRFNFKHFIEFFELPQAEAGDEPQAKRRKMDEEQGDPAFGKYIYKQKLQKMVHGGKHVLVVDFQHVYKNDKHSQVAWWIVLFPNQILPLVNEAACDLCRDTFEVWARDNEDERVHVAFDNFPTSDMIRKLRHKNLNTFVKCEAVVTRRTQVFNKLRSAWLTCLKCEEDLGPLTAENSDLENLMKGRVCENPTCGSKGPWEINVTKTTYENYQQLTIQEPPGTVLAGRMPRSKDAILMGEMVDSVKPGDLVSVSGVYQAKYDVELNANTSFPVFKTEIAVNWIKKKHDEKVMNLTADEIRNIKSLSRETDIRERVIQSLAPSIHGEPHVKTAVALAMFGGCSKIAAGGHRIRGDLNALILGDPGMAKSQFLKYVAESFPRAVYTTGKGASAVGLTAAVGRDPVSGEWVLEGGAMVLADQGICLIDEFDKMNDQDRTSIHEAMEQQTISISKAGICATLSARCAVIAAANPKYGRYDSQLTFQHNVDLTDPILSRFDVLCVLKDVPDSGRDVALADFVVCSHMRSHPDITEEGRKKVKTNKGFGYRTTIEPLDQQTLQNYIQFARKNVKPKVSDMDRDKIARFYQEIRKEATQGGGNKMTVRHVESMVRIAEANAKIELREQVTKRDVDHAIAIMLESFCQTQKHAHAQELRKKFQHYILAVQDHFTQLHGLLSQAMTRAEVTDATLTGADREHGETYLTKDAFVREAQTYKLEGSVDNYLKSAMFEEHFKFEELGIRRITDEERFGG